MNKQTLRPLRYTWFIVLVSVMILACADTPDGGDGGVSTASLTFVNTTDFNINIWVDGVDRGWLNAGVTVTDWFPLGSHTFEYIGEDGFRLEPETIYFESGVEYTTTIEPD